MGTPVSRMSVQFAPADVAELVAKLQSAAGEGLTFGIGRSSSDIANVVLSLEHLNAPIEHSAGDLVATVAAGATLAEVNTLLRRGGQWLPLDPPDPKRSTIGKIVAANDSGPRRHRYGTPRDLILGIEMVLADGRVAKAGGRVVKNVAGYDLARLMCGSYGSLAIITSATFKLSPVSAASRTLIVEVPDVESLGELARAVAAAPVTPSALELESPPHRLLIRFETTAAAADRQAVVVGELCTAGGVSFTIVADAAERGAWRAYEARIWEGPGTLLKVAVLPTDVPGLVDELARAALANGVTWSAGGRAALGVLYFRLTNNDDCHGRIAAELRHRARAGGGSLVIVSTDAVDGGEVDRWGDIGDALPLMRAVKARFDPNGILNPGGGPGGL
jgi:glycolate dehydrogenase FAD-binding subunit